MQRGFKLIIGLKLIKRKQASYNDTGSRNVLKYKIDGHDTGRNNQGGYTAIFWDGERLERDLNPIMLKPKMEIHLLPIQSPGQPIVNTLPEKWMQVVYFLSSTRFIKKLLMLKFMKM